jgi:hypothetical protein
MTEPVPALSRPSAARPSLPAAGAADLDGDEPRDLQALGGCRNRCNTGLNILCFWGVRCALSKSHKPHYGKPGEVSCSIALTIKRQSVKAGLCRRIGVELG